MNLTGAFSMGPPPPKVTTIILFKVNLSLLWLCQDLRQHPQIFRSPLFLVERVYKTLL